MLDPASDLGDRALGARSYEELYIEHAPAARRLALSMVPPDVADDIVAEAFARVLAAIRAGGGPSHAFRGYLLTAVRNLACDWLQARGRLTVVGDMDVQADDEPAGPGRVNPGIGCAAETQAEARDEVRLVTRAFGRLPARWRAVLWQLEVEGKAPAAVAPMFGLSANGVSALAMRAREGLRQAYLAEHVGSNIPAACRTYAAEFGAGARGRLGQRRRAAMQEHLGHCPACQDLFTELTELNSRLGAILTPAALAAASSALGSAKHTTLLRASLTSHWRTWRWHPVTTVTGAAAGVAVVGGMLLAVNVTPVATTPAHAAVQPAAPSGSFTRKREGGGGAGGSAASTAARSGSGSSSGPGSLTAAAPPGATAAALPGGSATGSPAAGPTQTSQAPSAAGTANAGTATTSASGNLTQTVTSTAGATVTGLADTASTTVTGLANTAGTTVTGVVNTVGATVTGLTNTTGATVTGVTNAASGLVSTATKAVTGVTNTATSAATGVASTANVTATTAGNTVSNVASQAASSTTTATAASTANAAASTASTATAAVTGLASAAVANL